ncbi:MAG: cobalamin biosynthesis protein [Lentisphaerales bacterium]|nr:cobalamin biosynthesis protein [Lentisphaerales bacterium]
MSKTFAVYVITKHGLEIAKDIKKAIPDADLYVSKRHIDNAPEGSQLLSLPMGPTLEATWKEYDCHIHIISVGAVIRMIAKYLENKKVDPAVICVDDAAKFAICALSGHVGRGNQFTERVAQAIDAQPVITTASDSMKTLTVDILGRDLGWTLDDIDRNITKGCAEVVNENRVCFIQETGEANFWPLDKELPKGVEYGLNLDDFKAEDYAISLICSDRDIKESHPEHWDNAVIYRPKSLVLGLGCDRDCPLETIEAGIEKFLQEEKLSIKSVKAVCSVNKKADEKALLELSEKNNWPFVTYTPEELDVVEGIENPSEVVKKYVGTRSVAEAACLLQAGAKKLVMPKKAFQLEEGGKNMTMAIARIPFKSRG